MAKKKENGIQADAINAIRSLGCNVWKVNGNPFSVPGLPDIQGFTPLGRFIGIETKAIGGKLSNDQQFWQDTLKASNCIVGVAFTAEEAKDIVHNLMSNNERVAGAYRANPALLDAERKRQTDMSADALKLLKPFKKPLDGGG